MFVSILTWYGYDLIFPKNNTSKTHNPGLQKNILPVHKSTNQGTAFCLSFCTFVQSEQILKHPHNQFPLHPWRLTWNLKNDVFFQVLVPIFRWTMFITLGFRWFWGSVAPHLITKYIIPGSKSHPRIYHRVFLTFDLRAVLDPNRVVIKLRKNEKITISCEASEMQRRKRFRLGVAGAEGLATEGETSLRWRRVRLFHIIWATLPGTNISHLGKLGKSSTQKCLLQGDMFNC